MRFKRHHRTLRTKLLIFGIPVVLVLIVGAVVGWVLLNTDSTVNLANSSTKSEQSASSTAFLPLSELPASLTIEKIGVTNAPIQPVGLTTDGAMDAPPSLAEVGWYNQSAKAGEVRYSVLLDGHYGTQANPGVFFRLGELAKDDEIILVGVDGSRLVYTVVAIETAPLEHIDMRKALLTYRPGVQSMTIITCDGVFDAVRQTYDKRTVVYAERVR